MPNPDFSFEVWQSGLLKMQTHDPKQVYDIDTLLQMKNAGCTFKLNGKKYVPKREKKS